MNWNDYEPIEPRTAEEVKGCETVDGIRRRIVRGAYKGRNPIIRAVFNMAEMRGLSGEDTYVILAFEALKQMERLEKLHLYQCMLNPMLPAIFCEKQP